jgi:peptidoglycan/xylan/chitin deacetylase (PgdA/CDA1 family)
MVRPLRHRAGLALALLAALPLLASCGGSSTSPSARASAPAARYVRSRAKATAPAHPALVAPASPALRTVHVPILMYHRVHAYATELTKSLPDLTVEPDVFAGEIAALDRAGYHSITVAQLFHALFDGAPLPPKPVLLSFDDGYVDDVTQILPVLHAHHMTGAFYIITGRFHEPGFLTRAQVRELDAAGMDIGAHTRDHVDLPGLGAAQLTDEIAGSRHDLERLLGHPVASFAYPAGRFDATVVAATRAAGFALAVTTQPGASESSQAPLTMPRVRVGRATTPQGLLACLAGASGGCGGGPGGG